MSQQKNKPCVIVGASHSGTQVAMRLRRLGWQYPITLVGDESHLPYHRPPLSKDYLKGAKSIDNMRLLAAAAYEKQDINLILGKRVVQLDRDSMRVDLDDGSSLDYGKLVLATGARPLKLAMPGTDLDGIFYLRTANDVDRIRDCAANSQRAVVIGGGYIGLEVAASLRMLGLEVTVLEAQDRVLQRVTSEPVSDFFTQLHSAEGVSIRTNALASAVHGDDSVTGIELSSGETIETDLVIVGIGVRPNTELAASAGIVVSNGIDVDEYARTNDLDIYATGDCSNFYLPRYEQRIRLESVQNANEQAATAAASICADAKPYNPLPWFWSDQFDVKLQIAGLNTGADLTICRVTPDTERQMSVLYLQGNQLLAVDAMNRPKDFIAGKKLIATQAKLNPKVLANSALSMTDAVVKD